jgi:hypothetical protein
MNKLIDHYDLFVERLHQAVWALFYFILLAEPVRVSRRKDE